MSELVLEKNNDLPPQWVKCEIQDVSDLISGKAFKKSEYSTDGVRLLQIANVSFGKIIWDNLEYLPTSYIKKYPDLRLNKDDVLLALNRPLIKGKIKVGRLVQNDVPAILYQRVGRFDFYEEQIDDYFYYYLQSSQLVKQLEASLQGVDQPFVNKSKLMNFSFPLPPLNEQKRIVSKIEELFSRINSTKQSLKHAKLQLEPYRQSLLKSAFEGKLTEKWREENRFNVNFKNISQNKKSRSSIPENVEIPDEIAIYKIPKSWEIISTAKLLQLGALMDLQDGNHGEVHPVKKEFVKEGTPFLTASEIKYYKIDFARTNKLPQTIIDRLRIGFAKKNDVILTHKATIGRVAITDRDCILSPQTTYYRVNSTVINNEYLMYFLASPFFKNQLDKVKSQTTRDYVSITKQFRFFCIICSIEEQEEIVLQIKQGFSLIENTTQTIESSLQNLQTMKMSVLKQAFEGKLVPQDPNDEPAEILLEKIKHKKEQLIQKQKASKVKKNVK